MLRKPSPSNSYPPNSPTKNTCQELKQSIQNLTGQPTPHPKVPNPKKSGLQLQPLQYFSPGDLYGCFQKKVVPQNGWFIMENPFFKREDLGGKPTIFGNTHIYVKGLVRLVAWLHLPLIYTPSGCSDVLTHFRATQFATEGLGRGSF